MLSRLGTIASYEIQKIISHQKLWGKGQLGIKGHDNLSKDQTLMDQLQFHNIFSMEHDTQYISKNDWWSIGITQLG